MRDRSGTSVSTDWPALLESLPIGLLVVDPGARIVFLNEYVEQMLAAPSLPGAEDEVVATSGTALGGGSGGAFAMRSRGCSACSD